jgi:hypothetical protein
VQQIAENLHTVLKGMCQFPSSGHHHCLADILYQYILRQFMFDETVWTVGGHVTSYLPPTAPLLLVKECSSNMHCSVTHTDKFYVLLLSPSNQIPDAIILGIRMFV